MKIKTLKEMQELSAEELEQYKEDVLEYFEKVDLSNEDNVVDKFCDIFDLYEYEEDYYKDEEKNKFILEFFRDDRFKDIYRKVLDIIQ
jgi:hypothetical protein